MIDISYSLILILQVTMQCRQIKAMQIAFLNVIINKFYVNVRTKKRFIFYFLQYILLDAFHDMHDLILQLLTFWLENYSPLFSI